MYIMDAFPRILNAATNSLNEVINNIAIFRCPFINAIDEFQSNFVLL